jgi:hypothetical protein
MASNINPNIINITYPIAGQDNDTQGFRDNFSNIKNNFSAAYSEISALQATLGSSLQSTTVPVSASATGTVGQVAFSSTYLYVCVATNTWVRASLATWP